jgi:hypothetical protein
LIFLWIAVSFLILVLNPNKDGRYIAPILPAAALVSAAALTTIPSHLLRRILIGVTIVWGSFLFVVSTFTQDLFPALRWLPSRAYVTIAGQGWIIYSSRYGHASPPRKEDWRQQAILEDVTIDAATHPGRTGQQISLLALPDAQYFHANTFQYYVTLQSRPIEVYRLAEILPLDPDYLRAATQSVNMYCRSAKVYMTQPTHCLPHINSSAHTRSPMAPWLNSFAEEVVNSA